MAMTLRLTAEQEAALAELAALEGVSKTDAVVRAVEERLARLSHQTEVLRYAREEAEHYSALLDRLGQ
ncbi:type II toxin-antitoxin system VapB family antitoxin [Sporichthya polymorpha]|uniref:type II toxin-antitoxin system VapB family antitoxin n=1 Tax=Sporichthya polymorpha TaxID=35751 RepID=UPI00048CA82D|nr:type II toxin-antitoxin system VapB family antitoxin [Sporichthya polymorpha]